MKKCLFACLVVAIGVGACSSVDTRPAVAPVTAAAGATPACPSCGHVEHIGIVTSAAPSAAQKPVMSGVVGGVLSRPAPASAGSTPAKRSSYRIAVRMDDGRRLVLSQAVVSPHLRVGSRVRVDGGRVTLLR